MNRVVVSEISNFVDDRGNEIICNTAKQKSKVIFCGRNCRLAVGQNVDISHCSIKFACDGGRVTFEDNCVFRGHIQVGLDSKISIGKGTTVTEECYINCAEGSSVTIGEDCMFASFVQIRGSDQHAIFDVNSGERINIPKDIIIGNHVWLAIYSIVLSGASIGDGCIVGAGSVCKSIIPNNCIIAGVPARVIRTDAAWYRPNILNNGISLTSSDSIRDKHYFNRTSSNLK